MHDRQLPQTPGTLHVRRGDQERMALLDLPDQAADDVNAVCTWCESPELFCGCPEGWKRLLEGWD